MASQIPPGTDLCQIPSGQPPPGVTPNLVDPPTLKTATITVTTIMMFFGVAFVVAGLLEHRHHLRLRDGFSALSLVLAIGYSACVLALTPKARHIWDFPVCDFDASYFKLTYASDILLGPTIFFAKASILLLYLEIFHVRKNVRYAIYAGLVFTFLVYWPNVGINSYFNAPHAGESWDLETISPRAGKTTVWGVIQGVLAVVIDIYIFILPIPLVRQLHLKTKKKIGVYAVFGTAILGIVASVVALVYRVREWRAADETWAYSIVFICVIVEDFVAIIIGVMPSFASYMRATIDKLDSLSSLRTRLFSTRGSGSISQQQMNDDLEGRVDDVDVRSSRKLSDGNSTAERSNGSSSNVKDTVTSNQGNETHELQVLDLMRKHQTPSDDKIR